MQLNVNINNCCIPIVYISWWKPFGPFKLKPLCMLTACGIFTTSGWWPSPKLNSCMAVNELCVLNKCCTWTSIECRPFVYWLSLFINDLCLISTFIHWSYVTCWSPRDVHCLLTICVWWPSVYVDQMYMLITSAYWSLLLIILYLSTNSVSFPHSAC